MGLVAHQRRRGRDYAELRAKAYPVESVFFFFSGFVLIGLTTLVIGFVTELAWYLTAKK